MPGNVAQPPFWMKESCSQELTFLSSAMFCVASDADRNLSAHIGPRTATRASEVSLVANSLALLSVVHPAQLKPTNAVTTHPKIAPCMRRRSDSPSRIAGNRMALPFARHVRSEYTEHRDESRTTSLVEGPAALIWRFGRHYRALLKRQSRQQLSAISETDHRLYKVFRNDQSFSPGGVELLTLNPAKSFVLCDGSNFNRAPYRLGLLIENLVKPIAVFTRYLARS